MSDEEGSQQPSRAAGKAPMPPAAAVPVQASAPPSVSNLPPPSHSEDAMHSRASDAGSVKDSASDAGSTATMDTSMSAGTLASCASTAFQSQQVQFFTLDEFAGHEIQTILEDGENEQPNEDVPADEASAENQSVRPGSVVSNIEQRLDEIEIFRGENEGHSRHDKQQHELSELADLLANCSTGGASSSSGGGGQSSAAAAEAHYMQVLKQMEHRDLTAADLQLLRRLEKEQQQQQQQASQGRFGPGAAGPSWAASGGTWTAPPPVAGSDKVGSSSSSVIAGGDEGGSIHGSASNDGDGDAPAP